MLLFIILRILLSITTNIFNGREAEIKVYDTMLTASNRAFSLMRQEIDGSQARWFLPCGQKLHNSRKLHKSKVMEEAGPWPDKR